MNLVSHMCYRHRQTHIYTHTHAHKKETVWGKKEDQWKVEKQERIKRYKYEHNV